jgi:hypothetical protein
MFVDTKLDDAPEKGQFHSLSFPSALSTRVRVCFHAFSALEMKREKIHCVKANISFMNVIATC